MGVCLEAWGTYLLSQDKPVEAGKLLTRALKVSKEVLGEEHEQVRVGTYFFFLRLREPWFVGALVAVVVEPKFLLFPDPSKYWWVEAKICMMII